jgi:hypothetical protein
MTTIFPPRKSPKYGKLVWTSGDFFVYETSGGLSLFLDEYLLGPIHSETDISKTRHSTYELWISAMRLKDMKKIAKAEAMIDETIKECELLKNIWDSADLG